MEIESLYSPAFAGRQISTCHHGFIGERMLIFTDRIDISKVDAVFVVDDSQLGRTLIENVELNDKLCIIDLSPNRMDKFFNNSLEYGLSEINRKPLVRGARMASIPSTVASLTLISLYPLVANSILSDELNIVVNAPEEFIGGIDVEKTINEIEKVLRNINGQFNSKISMRLNAEGNGRTMRVIVDMSCPLAISEIDTIYNSIYDDHNFTFTSLSKVGKEEVEGTQKCIISICKPGAGLVEIDTIGDCYMRGGAGDAVHVLNLLFALHEKVGLCLKPSAFRRYDESSLRQTSWFA